MAQIVFRDVGRDKWCGAIVIPDGASVGLILDKALAESRHHLMSHPDVEYDATTNKGVISAGWRDVGTFYVAAVEEK